MTDLVSKPETEDDDSEIETWHICKICNAKAFVDLVKLSKHQENHYTKSEPKAERTKPDDVSADNEDQDTASGKRLAGTTNVILDHHSTIQTTTSQINNHASTTERRSLRPHTHLMDDKPMTEDKNVKGNKPKLKLGNHNYRRKRTLKATTVWFSCKKCDKNFHKKCALTLHYRFKHHGQGVSKCVCGRSFSASQFLKLHSRKCTEFIKTNSVADEKKDSNENGRSQIYFKSTRNTRC